jgi:hypothetical protein
MRIVNLYMFTTPPLPCDGIDGAVQALPVPAVL